MEEKEAPELPDQGARVNKYTVRKGQMLTS